MSKALTLDDLENADAVGRPVQRRVSPLPVAVARRADDGVGVLRVFQNGAGDMSLVIHLREPNADGSIGAGVSFAPFQGGGRSPKVRAALIQLQHAIKDQNDEDPHGAG